MSSLTGPTLVFVEPFSAVCNGKSSIPQSGTTTLLSPTDERLMYPIAYLNFGDHVPALVWAEGRQLAEVDGESREARAANARLIAAAPELLKVLQDIIAEFWDEVSARTRIHLEERAKHKRSGCEKMFHLLLRLCVGVAAATSFSCVVGLLSTSAHRVVTLRQVGQHVACWLPVDYRSVYSSKMISASPTR